MNETTWFGTLTRPVSHLVGTIGTTALVVVCAVIAFIHPQWQPTLVLIAGVPFIVWTTAMAWMFHRAVAEPPDETA